MVKGTEDWALIRVYNELVKRYSEETGLETQRITRYDFYEANQFTSTYSLDADHMTLFKDVADFLIVRRIDVWNTTASVGTHQIKAGYMTVIQGSLPANGGVTWYHVSFRVPTTSTLTWVVSNNSISCFFSVDTTLKNYASNTAFNTVATKVDGTDVYNAIDTHLGTYFTTPSITSTTFTETFRVDLTAIRTIAWFTAKTYIWAYTGQTFTVKYQRSTDGTTWYDLTPEISKTGSDGTFYQSVSVNADMRYFRQVAKTTGDYGYSYVYETMAWG